MNLIVRARLWLGKLASFAFARVLMIFVIGFVAGVRSCSSGMAFPAIAGHSLPLGAQPAASLLHDA